MFKFFQKDTPQENLPAFQDTDIVSPVDGVMIPIETVKDLVFSQKMMGDGVAFEIDGDKVKVAAVANGTLSVMYPTGHAFGITTAEGVEFLVHIGIDTVNAKGDGFSAAKKQDETVKAGETIVTVDVKKLKKTYDMTTMLVITEANGKEIHFTESGPVKRAQIINQ